MSKVTFITPGGDSVVVDDAGSTLMEAAIDHSVDGIDADCGGVGSCATCHVRVHKDWMERVGRAEDFEQDILDLEEKASDCSRLACQIDLTEELDGLVVDVVGR